MPTDKQKSNKGKQKTTGKQRTNLVSLADRPEEERKEIARQGGIQSGVVKREKKYISQILADYLQEEHEVVLRDDDGNVIDRETIPADQLISRTVTAIMARGDSASASMIKTIGEITEGKNVSVNGMIETAALTPEQRKQRIEELLAKRGSK